MTIRPSGKARKRTQSVEVRQTREQMKAVLLTAVERHERVRKGWLDNLEAGARRIIDEADKMPAADLEDAGRIVHHAGLLREHERAGRVRDACLAAFEIRGAVERIHNRPLVEIARQETVNYIFWRMIAVRVTPLEAKICRFMERRTEADLATFYRACWGKPFNREVHGGRVRKALAELNATFEANKPPIRLRWTVRDSVVTLTEG